MVSSVDDGPLSVYLPLTDPIQPGNSSQRPITDLERKFFPNPSVKTEPEHELLAPPSVYRGSSVDFTARSTADFFPTAYHPPSFKGEFEMSQDRISQLYGRNNLPINLSTRSPSHSGFPQSLIPSANPYLASAQSLIPPANSLCGLQPLAQQQQALNGFKQSYGRRDVPSPRSVLQSAAYNSGFPAGLLPHGLPLIPPYGTSRSGPLSSAYALAAASPTAGSFYYNPLNRHNPYLLQ